MTKTVLFAPTCTAGPFLILTSLTICFAYGCAPTNDKMRPASPSILDASELISIAVTEMTKRGIEFREEDVMLDENNDIFDVAFRQWMHSPLLEERYGYLRERDYQAILVPLGEWRYYRTGYVVLVDRITGEVIEIISE